MSVDIRGPYDLVWERGGQRGSAGADTWQDGGWTVHDVISGGSGGEELLRNSALPNPAMSDIEDVLAAAAGEGTVPGLDGKSPTQRLRRAHHAVRSMASLRSFACGS